MTDRYIAYQQINHPLLPIKGSQSENKTYENGQRIRIENLGVLSFFVLPNNEILARGRVAAGTIVKSSARNGQYRVKGLSGKKTARIIELIQPDQTLTLIKKSCLKDKTVVKLTSASKNQE